MTRAEYTDNHVYFPVQTSHKISLFQRYHAYEQEFTGSAANVQSLQFSKIHRGTALRPPDPVPRKCMRHEA